MRKTGFTLIEILVGLTITALVFSGGYVSYREFARREALNSLTKALASDLLLAKQRALSGEKPPECTKDDVFDGYRVVFDQDRYQIVALCGSRTPLVREKILPENVSISGPTVVYKPLGQGTNLSGDTTITLTQTSQETEKITLSKEGTVK